MQEEANSRSRQSLTEQLGQEQQVVVVDPNRVILGRLLAHDVGETLIDARYSS